MSTPPEARRSGGALAEAMTGAAGVIGRLREGTALPAAIAAAVPPGGGKTVKADEAWRGAVQDLAYLGARRLAWADAMLARLVPQAPAKAVRDLLVIALSLLAEHAPQGTDATTSAASTTRPRYPVHTIVDQAVVAAAAGRATRPAKGMVNAVLRRFGREQAALTAAIAGDEVAHWNYPAWWIARVRAAYPAQWREILDCGNQPPPMTLRVDARRGDADAYIATLTEQGIEARRIGPQAVRLARPVPVTRLPGFATGLVSVQDAGAQLAAPLLDARAGMRVLDACAAPGGKTGHLLEREGVEVLALDSDATRAARIEANLARLGRQAEVRVGDAATPAGWWDGRAFDRILADVPCSASGIVRRHADIRWLRRDADIAALQATQRRIVDALWPLLAPGGRLLYATCSIFPDEGEAQAAWFEASRQDAVRLPSPGQLRPTTAGPQGGEFSLADHDGFFYALFEKRPPP